MIQIHIYHTKSPGDGERFVKEYCQKNGGARFIACGGDGTLSEVVNGVIGCTTAEVGVIPLGTGNDFCRNFEDCDFHNIALQMTGSSQFCDAIWYRTEINGKVQQGYCINMFNIGFDCSVADYTAEVKRKTIFSGSVAYFIAILVMLLRKKGYHMVVEADGICQYNGELLLTSLANGCFCGGGVKSNPMALLQDGNINFNIIKNISCLRFISLLPSYMKGTFLRKKNIHHVILSGSCKRVTVTPTEGKLRLCVDGEIVSGGKTEFEAVHRAFRFVVPKEMEHLRKSK